jgi:hypothetical protein
MGASTPVQPGGCRVCRSSVDRCRAGYWRSATGETHATAETSPVGKAKTAHLPPRVGPWLRRANLGAIRALGSVLLRLAAPMRTARHITGPPRPRQWRRHDGIRRSPNPRDVRSELGQQERGASARARRVQREADICLRLYWKAGDGTWRWCQQKSQQSGKCWELFGIKASELRALDEAPIAAAKGSSADGADSGDSASAAAAPKSQHPSQQREGYSGATGGAGDIRFGWLRLSNVSGSRM